jgi:tRNA (guanine-N7-)-methyltransferase
MKNTSDNDKHPARAFFGRRKGHALKPRQATLFDTLLPRIALDLAKPVPADLRRLFTNTADEVRLEIGFGGAEYLIAQGQAHPTIGFIGTDAFINGVAKALVAVDAHRLSNVRLYFGDASELLHWKRRFIQDESLKRLARILKPGGELRFATDIADYAAYALTRVLRANDFVWTAEQASDWHEPWPDFSGTRYEAKAKREGRVPAYFVFRRV